MQSPHSEIVADGRFSTLSDATNPIAPGFTLALGHTTSGAERIASVVRNARVVKAFNTTGIENMASPRYDNRSLVMPIAGDDPQALDVAGTLATELGFEAVALRGLSHARELEPLALLWVRLALQLGLGRSIGYGIVRRGGVEQHTAARTATRQSLVVVGTGNIGSALARAWSTTGHDVAIAARDPQSPEAVELATAGARIVPVAGAADRARVIVLAVPAAAIPDVLATIGSVDNKVIIDCTNAIGRGFQLQYGFDTSSSEELAKLVPTASVVRSFNQQGVEVLRDPRFAGVRATNFVAADDVAARQLVVALANDAGLDAIDVGPLAASRLLEPMTLLWVSMAKTLGTREFGFALLRRSA